MVVTNQPVIARGECSIAELENIHRKMQTLLGEHGAYVDRIYYCPHHPDSGFAGEVKALKKMCDCRKPGIGMITLAKEALNANLSESWMIGDSTADLLTAQSAGVRSILVETGAAGLDEKYPVLPHHTAPNLPSAVHFILRDYPRLLKQCAQAATDIRAGDMVLVGGLSRSGKSTLAYCLQETLKSKGLQAHIIAMDGWLKPLEDRGQTVVERYDLPALEQLLAALADRNTVQTIQVPIYSKREQRATRRIDIEIAPHDVIIVEGTIALMLNLKNSNHQIHRWYAQVDEQKRQKRLLTQYGLRGKSLDEAQSIYAQRQIDEAPWIEATCKQATVRIDLDLHDDLS